MLLRRPEFLILLLSVSALFLSIKLIDKLKAGEGESSISRKLHTFERNRIFYLKDSRCPRDALQNILMRFGYLRGLDFFLPGWAFQGQSHIFIQEAKFNQSQLQYLIHPGAVRITTLSNPEDDHLSIDSDSENSHFRLFTGANLTSNPTARRLGYAFPTFDPSYVGKFLDNLNDVFDLVLISEHREASLVLLCRLMDWPLENVVFLPREPTNEAKLLPTATERQKWRTINEVDFEIYSYFLRKFRQLVINYGQKRMIKDVNTLLTLNNRFAHACSVISKCRGTLESDKDLHCSLAETDEREFTKLIRLEQIRRSSAIKSLRKLLGSE